MFGSGCLCGCLQRLNPVKAPRQRPCNYAEASSHGPGRWVDGSYQPQKRTEMPDNAGIITQIEVLYIYILLYNIYIHSALLTVVSRT